MAVEQLPLSLKKKKKKERKNINVIKLSITFEKLPRGFHTEKLFQLYYFNEIKREIFTLVISKPFKWISFSVTKPRY